MHVTTFIERWTPSGASERANKDSYLKDLCSVLGVPHPEPTTGDRAKDRYVFEADAVLTHANRAESIGKIDLWKHGAFLLEAKQGSDSGASKVGTARRGTPSWVRAMQDAYGQALQYVRTVAEPPPFLIVADIGYCFDLYACFDGSTAYRPFPDGQASRVYVTKLADHVDLLRAIWTEPQALDPSRAKSRVTREIAGHVAELAAVLQGQGHAPEQVAKFLMRCLFTMFAEDVDLLPRGVFTDALAAHWIPAPERFVDEATDLWDKMNRGGVLFGAGKILRFEGELFADARALPLDAKGLQILYRAARCEWSDVEPAIFGTLLERALDARERHRLGAHYTPRAYVERLVKPTLEDPLRAAWDLARVEARQLLDEGKIVEACAVVGAFHRTLVRTRVLDPACGTGNFLYVALDTFKRLESEVLKLLEDLGDTEALFGPRVTPSQFLGIEKKPWAKEIAELVLWMGYLSWNARMRTDTMKPREPVLEDYGHIECRDAVLAWDAIEPVLDAEGRPVTRWDGETTKIHPVTGNPVPDDSARVAVVRYVNPRAASWPEAEFVVGNPPFIGGWKIRQTHGDGYVEALWAMNPNVPEKADYVMYWWDHAAELLRADKILRFGFITTNSITQVFQRRIVARHAQAESRPLVLTYAIADHPWHSTDDGAAVRIAMTVAASAEPATVSIVGVVTAEDEANVVVEERPVDNIAPNLRAGVNIDRAQPLRATAKIASPGVQLYGGGFILQPDEIPAFQDDDLKGVIRPYVNGRDLTARSRGVAVIDFSGLSVDEAAMAHPAAFQRALVAVKPERDQNRRAAIRETWWRFGWERPVLRRALAGLPRFVVTPETAKHRFFIFVDGGTVPDNMLTVIASDDGFLLAVLSARTHVTWALAAGGRLGVGNDPRYNKTRCFDPFPFPTPTPPQRARIADLGERLDAHRKARQALHADLTLTGMYNVLEKLRSGEALTDKERAIHERGLVSILKEIHDALDVAVAEAYGWPADLDDEGILERLVALNAERAAEEARGHVRWLRPDYQKPLARDTTPDTPPIPGLAPEEAEVPAASEAKVKWPGTLSERFAAVRAVVLRAPGLLSVEDVARGFVKAPRKEVESLLDSLAAVGIIGRSGDGERRWRGVR